jgi:hypothetical protein
MKIESVTRVCIEELPYIKSFVKYHLDQGVDRMILVNSSHERTDEMKEYLIEFGDNITIVPFKVKKVDVERDAIMAGVKKLSKNVWMIHLDADEYLVPPDKNIRAFFDRWEEEGYYGQIRFYFWIVSNDGDNVPEGKLMGIPKKNGRYAIPGDLIKKWRINREGINHFVSLADYKVSKNTALLHAAARSFKDILIRSGERPLYRDIGKETNVEKVKKLISEGRLPRRFKLLAQQVDSSRHKDPKKVNVNLEKMKHPVVIDYDVEDKILNEKWTGAESEKIKKLYLNYKKIV